MKLYYKRIILVLLSYYIRITQNLYIRLEPKIDTETTMLTSILIIVILSFVLLVAFIIYFSVRLWYIENRLPKKIINLGKGHVMTSSRQSKELQDTIQDEVADLLTINATTISGASSSMGSFAHIAVNSVSSSRIEIDIIHCNWSKSK